MSRARVCRSQEPLPGLYGGKLLISIAKLLNIMIWTSLPGLMPITCLRPASHSSHTQEEEDDLLDEGGVRNVQEH